MEWGGVPETLKPPSPLHTPHPVRLNVYRGLYFYSLMFFTTSLCKEVKYVSLQPYAVNYIIALSNFDP